MVTIEQLAKSLEVSKVTIYNKLNSLNSKLKDHIKKENGVTFIDSEGVIIIKNSISPKKLAREETIKKNQEQEQEENKDVFQLKLIESLEKQVEDLKKDKEELNKQLNTKDIQIESLTKLNENSQVLLGQAQQKVLFLESNEQQKSSVRKWWRIWY
jgi:predicted RNase H-like nuclease (RuvC/YqgF family)